MHSISGIMVYYSFHARTIGVPKTPKYQKTRDALGCRVGAVAAQAAELTDVFGGGASEGAPKDGYRPPGRAGRGRGGRGGRGGRAGCGGCGGRAGRGGRGAGRAQDARDARGDAGRDAEQDARDAG